MRPARSARLAAGVLDCLYATEFVARAPARRLLRQAFGDMDKMYRKLKFIQERTMLVRRNRCRSSLVELAIPREGFGVFGLSWVGTRLEVEIKNGRVVLLSW